MCYLGCSVMHWEKGVCVLVGARYVMIGIQKQTRTRIPLNSLDTGRPTMLTNGFGKLSTQTSHRDNYRERLLEVIGLRRSSLLLGRAWLRYRLQAAFQSKELALFLLNFTSKTFQIGPLDIIAQGGRGCHFLEQGGFATVNDTSRTLRLS